MIHKPIRHAPLIYFGGKSKIAKWVCKHLPTGGRPYVEPFCGAASILLYREPAPVEVINDIDGDIVNLFRVLRDEELFPKLERKLLLTPYARAELELALSMETEDPVERAWRTMVLYNFGTAGLRAASIGNWGRAITYASRGVAGTVNSWLCRLALLGEWHERLMRVQVDNRDALDVLDNYDNPEAIFYIDPPYHWSARRSGSLTCDVGDNYHDKLVDKMLTLRGSAVLSGYSCEPYKRLEKNGWARVERAVACFAVSCTGKRRGMARREGANADRIECLWINPLAQEKLNA